MPASSPFLRPDARPVAGDGIDAFRRALSQGRRDIRLIVPTPTLVRHFQHELAREGFVFPPNLIVTLHQFTTERTVGAEQVPGALLHAIARDVLGPKATAGMAAAVVETIELFEDAGIGRLPRGNHFESLWRAIRARVRAAGFLTKPEIQNLAATRSEPVEIIPVGFTDPTVSERRRIDSWLPPPLFASAASADFALPRRDPARTAVVAAANPGSECAEIARRIVELHGQGIPLRRIAIALRDTALYLPLLRVTLERFQIPARFYFANPLETHPVSTLLNGIVEAAFQGYDFGAMVDALRAHPRWGTAADFDRFDFAVREAMPGAGRAEFLAVCEKDWLRNELAACLDLDLHTRRTPDGWCDYLDEFAAGLYRPGRIETPRDQTSAAVARSHTVALETWAATLRSIVRFWPDQNADLAFETFWRVARPALEAAVWQAPDNRTGAIHVMSAREARQWDLAALFICGLADGRFPRRKRPNPFFPDPELRRLGVPLDHERDERALFDVLRTRASECLILTFPRRDDAGRTVQPSRYLDDFGAPGESIACRPAPTIERPARASQGRIASPALLSQLPALHPRIGMTRLEDLAQCRFKFFGMRTLELLARPERPAERLDARITGLVLHRTMELWLSDRTRDLIEVFEQAFSDFCREKHVPPGYRVEVERMRSREIARTITANERWWPSRSMTEMNVELAFPGGIVVSGRVDRIDAFDEFPGECVIVDYKSGGKAGIERLVTSRTKLQGPLYALGVREKTGLNPAAVLFWAVRDDQRYGWGKVPGTDLIFREMTPNWASEARDFASERLLSFLRGEVQARPQEEDECRFCDLAGACRVEQTGLAAIEGAHAG